MRCELKVTFDFSFSEINAIFWFEEESSELGSLCLGGPFWFALQTLLVTSDFLGMPAIFKCVF